MTLQNLSHYSSQNFLLIDIGNTRTKWAIASSSQKLNEAEAQDAHKTLHKNLEITEKYIEASSTSSHTCPEYLHTGAFDNTEMAAQAQIWTQLFAEPPAGVCIANVAGPLIQEEISAQLVQYWGAHCHMHYLQATEHQSWQYNAKNFDLWNGYHKPAQLGSDRWAAMIGARTLFPELPLLIANSGTALTLDAINAHGEFLGGFIVPGLAMMLEALSQGTAQLPPIDARQVSRQLDLSAYFPKSTADALTQGALRTHQALFEQSYELLIQQLASYEPQKIQCIVTGGMRETLLRNPFKRVFFEREHLVLDGLFMIALEVFN